VCELVLFNQCINLINCVPVFLTVSFHLLQVYLMHLMRIGTTILTSRKWLVACQHAVAVPQLKDKNVSSKCCVEVHFLIFRDVKFQPFGDLTFFLGNLLEICLAEIDHSVCIRLCQFSGFSGV
jgi:hypothetical protein